MKNKIIKTLKKLFLDNLDNIDQIVLTPVIIDYKYKIVPMLKRISTLNKIEMKIYNYVDIQNLPSNIITFHKLDIEFHGIKHNSEYHAHIEFEYPVICLISTIEYTYGYKYVNIKFVVLKLD